jgi:lipoprotein-anchoring transpeptidase ErfK/SrfK
MTGGHGSSGAMTRLWRLALLTSVTAVGATTRADAALYYWQSAEPSYWQSESAYRPPPRQKLRRSGAKKQEPEKETGAKPQGPLIISVSIDQQKVRIFDANGFFAEAPVSTGMRGHPTPMGVFSIIQKHKYHHSNIYSGAPMPYMQRITWSGVAMHAGVLPGYPASHGCIRMPMAFAVKMWNWTKMGARVFVTPGELTPSNFSHPFLAALKVPPQPAAAKEPETDTPPAAKADKAAPEKQSGEPRLELRSTVGHADDVKPEIAAAAPLRDRTHTADASGDVAPPKAAATITDAPDASAAPAAEPASPEARDDSGVKVADAAAAAAPQQKEAVGAEPAAVAKPEQKSPEIKAEAAAPEVKSDAAKAEVAEPPKPTAAPDAGKDQARLPDAEKPVVKPELPKRTGQIAVFISRKDSKLYVRQNFAPLFDVPVTIAPSDRPLGTHVFTAEVDKSDANVLHWSVVSVPMSARAIHRAEDDEHVSRRRRVAGASAVETRPMPVPDSPAEALDRITVPADAMARVNEALTTGGSIIVSDQGINQGETGEGTDFIVSLR